MYAIFEVMHSRRIKIEKGNLEIVINLIQDQNMTKLVAYKKGTSMSMEPASGSTQRIHFKTSDKELTP